MQSGASETLSLWRSLIAVHLIMFLMFGMLLDCGELSTPGGLYCITIILYLSLRMGLGGFTKNGYPSLTTTQRSLFVLLTLYGPILFISLFHLGQYLRYGY